MKHVQTTSAYNLIRSAFVDEEPRLLCAKCLIEDEAANVVPTGLTSKLPIELIGLVHLCGRCGRKRRWT